MEANLIALAAFLATFGGLYGLYALAMSYRAAAERLQRERDGNGFRRSLGGGRMIGGTNRPGEN